MITFDQAMGAMDDPAIKDLNTWALDKDDVVNLILQRSEIIRDMPNFNSYIRAWIRNDMDPMIELIDRMGMDTLIRRAAAFIYLEYLQLRPIFEAKKPVSVADIGCGYALFDLFLAKDYGSELYLIDLESNENRHFGFQQEGAAYSSLKSAAKLLTDNGVAQDKITLLNPKTDDVHALKDLDFAFSFISCGFHYPWQTYRTFFEKCVAPGGRIIVDLRNRILRDTIAELSEIGYVRIVEKAANNSADRVMIAKIEGI